MFSAAGEGFILGLSLGFSCLGTCLPVLLPYLLSEERGMGKNFSGIMLFMGGRFAGYVGFGALFGALGGALPTGSIPYIQGPAYAALGGLLIYQALSGRKEADCPAGRWRKLATHPALFGLLLGISPCPAFLLAISGALTSGGALRGAVLFVGFFLGTSIFFLPLVFIGELSRFSTFKYISRGIALLVGSYFVVAGVISLSAELKRPEEVAVFDPLEADTIYSVGDSISSAYFGNLFEKEEVLVKFTKMDSVPGGGFVVCFDEAPADSADALNRGIGYLRTDPDSAGAETAAEFLKKNAFRRPGGAGFYFDLKENKKD